MVLDEVRHAWLKTKRLDDVVETVYRSTRHVVATTITAGTGVLPLIIAGGDFWPPMAIVIVGGESIACAQPTR
jgi:multidrug efflux pump subunit AcrB